MRKQMAFPITDKTPAEAIDWPAQRRISEQQGKINELTGTITALREALADLWPDLRAIERAYDEGGEIDRGAVKGIIGWLTDNRALLNEADQCDDCGRTDGTHDPDVEH